jgi:phosphatidylglycerophosphatase A
MYNFIIKTLSTFFYIGYLPLIPGTAASLAALVLYYFIKDSFFYKVAILSFTVLGFLIGGSAEKIFKKKDHSSIVIDEVSGMLLSLAFIRYNFTLTVIAFFVFRIMDTLKPYPADKMQRLKGSLGIMSDDIVAGLYTNIVLQAVIRLTSFKTS